MEITFNICIWWINFICNYTIIIIIIIILIVLLHFKCKQSKCKWKGFLDAVEEGNQLEETELN